MDIHRDTTAVILYRDRIILKDRNLDIRTIPCESFVNGVVYHLINKVMHPFLTDVANVHGRAFAHSLQPFKDLNTTGRILLLLR